MTDLQIDAEELEEKTEKNQSKIRILQQTEATIRCYEITSSYVFVFVGTSDDFLDGFVMVLMVTPPMALEMMLWHSTVVMLGNK